MNATSIVSLAICCASEGCNLQTPVGLSRKSFDVKRRVLAVALLADNGLYCFAPDDLVRGLVRLGVATLGLLAIVSRLREAKIAYRRGNANLNKGITDIYVLIDALDKCFKLGIHVNSISLTIL